MEMFPNCQTFCETIALELGNGWTVLGTVHTGAFRGHPAAVVCTNPKYGVCLLPQSQCAPPPPPHT